MLATVHRGGSTPRLPGGAERAENTCRKALNAVEAVDAPRYETSAKPPPKPMANAQHWYADAMRLPQTRWPPKALASPVRVLSALMRDILRTP